MSKLLSEIFSSGLFEVYSSKPSQELIQINQVHSNIVKTSEGESLEKIDGDGIIISYKDLDQKMLAIKTADCLPILLLGDDSAALIHAGWKGLRDSILIDPKISKLSPVHIFIGPSIYNYEVTNEFRQNFPDSDAFEDKSGKLFFSLQKEALSQLRQAYVNANIQESRVCTLENNQYNSYRRNKTNERNWNIFRLN